MHLVLPHLTAKSSRLLVVHWRNRVRLALAMVRVGALTSGLALAMVRLAPATVLTEAEMGGMVTIESCSGPRAPSCGGSR